MSDLLQKMHLSVKLSVAEILALEQGRIPRVSGPTCVRAWTTWLRGTTATRWR